MRGSSRRGNSARGNSARPKRAMAPAMASRIVENQAARRVDGPRPTDLRGKGGGQINFVNFGLDAPGYDGTLATSLSVARSADVAATSTDVIQGASGRRLTRMGVWVERQGAVRSYNVQLYTVANFGNDGTVTPEWPIGDPINFSVAGGSTEAVKYEEDVDIRLFDGIDYCLVLTQTQGAGNGKVLTTTSPGSRVVRNSTLTSGVPPEPYSRSSVDDNVRTHLFGTYIDGAPHEVEELLTNPSFDVNIDGWTPFNGSAVSFMGVLVVQNTGSVAPRAYQDIGPGKGLYRLRSAFFGATGTDPSFVRATNNSTGGGGSDFVINQYAVGDPAEITELIYYVDSNETNHVIALVAGNTLNDQHIVIECSLERLE